MALRAVNLVHKMWKEKTMPKEWIDAILVLTNLTTLITCQECNRQFRMKVIELRVIERGTSVHQRGRSQCVNKQEQYSAREGRRKEWRYVPV